MLSYAERISILRERKIAQTQEKLNTEGGLNEDDYGRVVPPADFNWRLSPNHRNGSFYGYRGWSENFYNLLSVHPLYVDPLDAFAGRWMFFLSRMKGPVWNPDYPYDDLENDFKRYDIISGIGGDAHFATDYHMGLALGFGGIADKLEKYKKINGEKSGEFYDAELKTVAAVQLWIRRTIGAIAEREQSEEDPQLKENLRQMRACNERIIAAPPRTLREVCQWICWVNMAKRTYNRDGAGSQLDELLRPYFEAEMAAGQLTEDEARFYIACLLLNDTHYYQLAGRGPDGKDMTSRISYLILEAAAWINSSCNLTVRVHDGIDERFFLRSVKYLFEAKNGWPRYSGDKALEAGFMRCGFSRELAGQRIAVGCNWMSLPGLEYTLNDLVKINLARVFEIAFAQMMKEDSQSVTGLWRIFERHLEKAVRAAGKGIAHHMKYQVYNEPELVLNLLSHGPVEKGLDVSAGGAQYYNLAIDGAGIAVAADSFAALQQRIEKEKRTDWGEVSDAIANNYENYERLRLMLGKSSRYGEDNGDADNGGAVRGGSGNSWGMEISKLFTQKVRALNETYPQYNFIPGLFSWANTLDFGKAVGATPNGRRAGEAINHGANPLPGFRKDGAVTALANTIAAVQPGYGNTAPIQLELDPGISPTDEAVEKIAALIKTMFSLGATLLNINIIDAKKILDAHKDPEKYPDLVVRVTGFTAYFAMLSEDFRQLVVERIITEV